MFCTCTNSRVVTMSQGDTLGPVDPYPQRQCPSCHINIMRRSEKHELCFDCLDHGPRVPGADPCDLCRSWRPEHFKKACLKYCDGSPAKAMSVAVLSPLRPIQVTSPSPAPPPVIAVPGLDSLGEGTSQGQVMTQVSINPDLCPPPGFPPMSQDVLDSSLRRLLESYGFHAGMLAGAALPPSLLIPEVAASVPSPVVFESKPLTKKSSGSLSTAKKTKKKSASAAVGATAKKASSVGKPPRARSVTQVSSAVRDLHEGIKISVTETDPLGVRRESLLGREQTNVFAPLLSLGTVGSGLDPSLGSEPLARAAHIIDVDGRPLFSAESSGRSHYLMDPHSRASAAMVADGPGLNRYGVPRHQPSQASPSLSFDTPMEGISFEDSAAAFSSQAAASETLGSLDCGSEIDAEPEQSEGEKGNFNWVVDSVAKRMQIPVKVAAQGLGCGRFASQPVREHIALPLAEPLLNQMSLINQGIGARKEVGRSEPPFPLWRQKAKTDLQFQSSVTNGMKSIQPVQDVNIGMIPKRKNSMWSAGLKKPRLLQWQGMSHTVMGQLSMSDHTIRLVQDLADEAVMPEPDRTSLQAALGVVASTLAAAQRVTATLAAHLDLTAREADLRVLDVSESDMAELRTKPLFEGHVFGDIPRSAILEMRNSRRDDALLTVVTKATAKPAQKRAAPKPAAAPAAKTFAQAAPFRQPPPPKGGKGKGSRGRQAGKATRSK